MILSPDFCDHYKTKILIKLAGHAGVYSLLKLWGQCQFRRSERLEKPPEIIATIADWNDDPVKLEKALIESGYAKREGKTLIMHDWENQNKKIISNYTNGKKGGRPKSSGSTDSKSEKKPFAFKL
jgi:hypothetical protein